MQIIIKKMKRFYAPLLENENAFILYQCLNEQDADTVLTECDIEREYDFRYYRLLEGFRILEDAGLMHKIIEDIYMFIGQEED